jgi:benzoate membrane transport protein
LSAALPIIFLFIIVLSIPLTVAQELGLSAAETTSWILVLYGLPSVLSLTLSLLYRQPLLITGNIFAFIFLASLGDQLSYPELIGAYILAGVTVVLVSVLRLTGRLGAWIPEPVVLGLLAGAIVPFVTSLFTALGEAPVLVGGVFLTYLLGRRVLGTRLPAIFPALVAGLVIAGLTRQFGQVPARLTLPVPAVTRPVFSVQAILTATPVLVVLMTVQANLPSMIFMKSQGFHPPERTVDAVSGIGTLLGSLLGPVAVSVSLPATSFVAGPVAGELPLRHRAIYFAGGAGLLIGLLAGVAAELPVIIPTPLLLALAGLAVLDVLANTLQRSFQGPLLLGPLMAFAIALSEITLFGFGPFFWSLVLGTGVTLLLERDAFRKLRAGAAG